VFVLLPLVVSTFTYLKFLIPFIRPFELDPVLAGWDRWLHGGQYPWTLLQHLLGHPYATAVVNVFYQLWLFVTWGVLLWQCVSLARPRLRMRFLITFVLLWILLGNVAATLLSSAGPVYYGRVTGLADPFAPLMAYLHQASAVVWLPALQVQDLLWESRVERSLVVGAGISAMPSLHVATSFCSVLLGFAINRWLGIGFGAFCAMILIGSIHLGWHYAIDGYAAIIGTWLIWCVVGVLLERPPVARLLWGGT
jgi:PAP2 superfamily